MVSVDIDEAISVSVIAVPSENAEFGSDPMIAMDDIIDVTTVRDAPVCIVCEFVMAKLETELADKKTQVSCRNLPYIAIGSLSLNSFSTPGRNQTCSFEYLFKNAQDRCPSMRPIH